MWSDWLVFCDYGFSVSALWCPLTIPTVLLGFLLPWTSCLSWFWTWSSYLGSPSPTQPPLRESRVAPPTCCPWLPSWGSCSCLPPFRSDSAPASIRILRHKSMCLQEFKYEFIGVCVYVFIVFNNLLLEFAWGITILVLNSIKNIKMKPLLWQWDSFAWWIYFSWALLLFWCILSEACQLSLDIPQSSLDCFLNCLDSRAKPSLT